jgi:hypothetical protein
LRFGVESRDDRKGLLAEGRGMIFELEFLRYGKHDNRPVKIARMMEIAPDVEAVKARVRHLPGTSAWPEGAEAVRILDHEGHEVETWRWSEDDAQAFPHTGAP